MRRSTHKLNSTWIRGLCALTLIAALPLGWATGMSPAPAAQQRLLSLDFVDADIVDVVKALSTQSGENVVVAGSATGKTITVRLSGVTLEQALGLVTRPNGLDYRRVDGSYVVAPASDLASYGESTGPAATKLITLANLTMEQAQTILETSAPGVKATGAPGSKAVVLAASSQDAVNRAVALLTEIDQQPARPTTQVVALKHVPPASVVNMLAETTPTVKVDLGPASGTVLLTGLGPDVAEAVALINTADTAAVGAASEFEVYQIRYADPIELQEKVQVLVPDVQVTLGPKTITPMIMDPAAGGGSTSWLKGPMAVGGGGLSSGGGAGGEGSVEASPVTTLILAGPRDAIDRAKRLLAAVDVASPMIAIAALIAEGNVSDISRKGIDWTGLGEGGTGFMLSEAAADHWYRLGRISRSTLDISATLRALINDNKLHVLSRPNIVVLSGRQATLHSGQTVYYKKQIGIDDRGFPIYDIEQIPVGVTLVINPRLAADGEIVLTIQPIVSSLSDNPYFPDMPLVAEHRTLTTVRIKAGEVLVIAGLMRDSDEVITSRVPILSEIPVIGPALFRHREKRKISTELMIFIEPVPVQYPTDVDVMKPAE
jgi:type II secretory pathway component GspD/PulD (secretin)